MGARSLSCDWLQGPDEAAASDQAGKASLTFALEVGLSQRGRAPDLAHAKHATACLVISKSL